MPSFMKICAGMARPVTLFAGQWADLSVADFLPKVKEMGLEELDL